MKKTPYLFIECFLKKKALNSKNTATNYENDIRMFFKMVKHKDIEMLTENDLQITVDDVEDYQVRLATNNDIAINKGEPYASASIARKISSVKKLYNKLEANAFNVKESWFNVDKVKGESNSYGVLEWDEVQQMMEIVKDEEKGDIKACLLETAVVTCFRQNSLLNLTWDNIEKHDGVWVLCAVNEAVGKGKKSSKKAINDDLYEKLMELKEKYNSKTIFPLQKKTVVRMMIRLREKMGLDDDITFHSLKKCGISEAYDLSGGNIMVVVEQADHESFGTTMKHYMNKKKKYNEMISLKIGRDIDISPFDELSRDEILALVKNASRSVQIELLNSIKNPKKS